MIGITSTAKGKGLNKSPKTALSPTFQPPHLPSPIGIPRSSHLSPETNIKIQNQFIYSNLKEYRCKPQNSPVWLVQGAAIYINIAAPCTTEIHTENQHLTLLVKPRVQPRFLHHLLILCFSCNPVIPKNKKSPKHFPFSVKIPIFASVPRAERSNAAKPAQLPNRYRLPNFLLFKSYLPTDYKKTIVFLKKSLGEYFKRVVIASDGVEALQLTRNHAPDIIVSDVMMPRMNGYELCKNIKEDITISHIPIILLTARDDKQSQLSGYKNGADAYLTKPFEIEMLMEIIRNRLKNRESIKKRYLNTGLVPAPEESTFSQADETFLLKLNKIIQEHLDSSNLDVTFICKEIGMSRASLYNKLKALTDMGANDYINKFRMEKAITLITSTDMSFTEIAEKVGFTTSRYFSTAFKQYTGETPTQYKEKRKQERKKE